MARIAILAVVFLALVCGGLGAVAYWFLGQDYFVRRYVVVNESDAAVRHIRLHVSDDDVLERIPRLEPGGREYVSRRGTPPHMLAVAFTDDHGSWIARDVCYSDDDEWGDRDVLIQAGRCVNGRAAERD